MEFANKLCKSGHEITIVAQKINNQNYKFDTRIKLIEVGGFLPTNPLYWIFFECIKKKYLNAFKNMGCDIMVSIGFPANYFCFLSSKKTNIPHVFYCCEPFRYFHDKKFYSNASFFFKFSYMILGLVFKNIDILATQGANGIICISNFVKSKVKETYGRDCLVHHIGIDTSFEEIEGFNLKKILKIDSNKHIILALGLTHHLKGERQLIYIFNRIKSEIKDTVLLIGGWKAKQNEKIMRKIASKLNIYHEDMMFYGFIEPKFLDSFYRGSSVTLYPSVDESYGYIPIESMKNGTPVVAFEGGPSDTIIDGKTGFIIKNIDLDRFAAKAIEIIRNNSLRSELSKNSIEHIRNNFNIEESCKELEKNLESFLK
jgi:glycosyltransferase involved in cell wall biosynthesis